MLPFKERWIGPIDPSHSHTVGTFTASVFFIFQIKIWAPRWRKKNIPSRFSPNDLFVSIVFHKWLFLVTNFFCDQPGRVKWCEVYLNSARYSLQWLEYVPSAAAAGQPPSLMKVSPIVPRKIRGHTWADNHIDLSSLMLSQKHSFRLDHLSLGGCTTTENQPRGDKKVKSRWMVGGSFWNRFS